MSASKMAGWFLGPKAENAEPERAMLARILDDYFQWRRNSFPSDQRVIHDGMRGEATEFHNRLEVQLKEMLAGLRGHFPCFSPRYIGHMISDQTLPSILGYFAGLLYNPNNVSPESSPVTLDWELEIGADVLGMLGYTRPPAKGQLSNEEFGWAHVTSGGTVANLEALWLARNVHYFPLAVQDVCQQRGIAVWLNFRGDRQPLGSLSQEACLGIAPSEGINLYAQFIDAVRSHWHLTYSEGVRVAHELIRDSKYSVAHQGTSAAYGVRPPVLLVSGARHYSITKAADLLGIGRENIMLVDVDERFRMDVRDLEAKLERVTKMRSLPLAVIAIAGTTEEGAVDPVDRIAALRKRNETLRGESFWLHIDAAWGGYLRALFKPDAELESIRAFVSREMEINTGSFRERLQLEWGDPDVCAAFRAFPHADSITVDPHKLGYVPYPCGVAAYRDDLVRQFLTEEIPYISDVHFEDVDSRRHRAPTSVGPYILEGSKPGSAVAACWLSHRMIPLDRSGHGEILRASLLAARELYERLMHWDETARANHQDLPYRILTVTGAPPDTNIVCFFLQQHPSQGLEQTNALNRWIYQRFTLDGSCPESLLPPFFLSRTVLEPSVYSSTGIRALLDRAGIEPADYRMHGLFVLRATLMSPYHVLATETGGSKSLLAEFLERLHEQALAGLVAVSPESCAV
jgi:glutamate/tyrosine decarboxylase-like PLP-dependent enzyme